MESQQILGSNIFRIKTETTGSILKFWKLWFKSDIFSLLFYRDVVEEIPLNLNGRSPVLVSGPIMTRVRKLFAISKPLYRPL